MLIVIITTSYFVVMDEHTSTIMLNRLCDSYDRYCFGLMPVMTHTMNQLTPEMNAHGSSMTNTVQQISGSIGTAGLITILSQASQHFSPKMSDYKGMNKQEIIGQIKIDTMLHGYHAGFLFAVIITVISFLCTFMIKKTSKSKTQE